MKGTMVVSVAKDMMVAEAYVTLSDQELTVKSAIVSLSQMGISGGILKENLEAMIEGEVYDKTYIVAKGREPGETIPGHVEYMVDISDDRGEPNIKEDGSVDFGKRRALVHNGDLIAVYHHSKSGVFGYTVYASVIAPKPVTEETIVCGDGTIRDGDNIYATIDGEVVVSSGVLTVRNSLVINGDAKYGIDTKTEFTGDVYIKGDVLSGVSIVAEGNIEVEGVVEACTLRAGRDIIIKKGIHGQGTAIIDALGSVFCPFIEDAKVNAGNEVHADTILNAYVHGNNSVIVKGPKASIIGGIVSSTNLIETEYAGNAVEVTTRLEIRNYDKTSLRSSKIIIHKMMYPEAFVMFNGVAYKGRNTRNGEFHLIEDVVRLYNIGEYVELVVKTPVNTRKKILLIDDEPIVLKTFYTYLSDKYQVMIAASPEDALAQLNNNVPDLVLLDYKMPVMDGGEFLATIRKTTWKAYCNVPVIFVSAMTDKDVITKCLKLYPQGYILKPLTRDELHAAVDKFFITESLNSL